MVPRRGDSRNRTGDQGVADPRLTAWLCRPIKRMQRPFGHCISSLSWTRTNDTAVNSRVLYRLSYEGILLLMIQFSPVLGTGSSITAKSIITHFSYPENHTQNFFFSKSRFLTSLPTRPFG